MSHITERVGGHYLPLRVGACITYSQGLSSFSEELTQTVRPDMLLCVPRLWENMHDTFLDGCREDAGEAARSGEWGLKIGEEAAMRRSEGKACRAAAGLQHLLADKTRPRRRSASA